MTLLILNGQSIFMRGHMYIKIIKSQSYIVSVWSKDIILWVSKYYYLVKLLVSSFIDTTHNNFWKTNPVTDTRYQINSESLLTWHQARKSCQQQNAELLSITDLREEMYLLGKIKKPSNIKESNALFLKCKSARSL